LRDLFIVTDPDEIEAMLHTVRLGSLVTHGPEGMAVSHIPFVYDPAERRLIGHVSRNNPQPPLYGGGEAVAVFVGPNAYITPSWYPSKQEHGRVAPTWNYEVLEVYGTVTFIDDQARMVEIVTLITDRFEGERQAPWAVADAPADYVEKLSRGIIGVELAIGRVEAKRVFSQQRTDADREGAVAGLLASDNPANHLVAAKIKAAHGG